jgi:hypothetical protein
MLGDMSNIPVGGLIRDQLEGRLEAEGYQCRTRQIAGRELQGAIASALTSAVSLYLAAPSAERAAEAADLLKRAAAHQDIAWNEVETQQKSLLNEQGTYSDIILEAAGPRPAKA